MNGNYQRYIDKVKNYVNMVSNNYLKLLSQKIDKKYTYLILVSLLSSYLECEYINKTYGKYYAFNGKDREFSIKQQGTQDMKQYISQVVTN